MNKLLAAIGLGLSIHPAKLQAIAQYEKELAEFERLSKQFGIRIATQNQKRLLLMGAPGHIVESDMPSELYKMQNHIPI